MIDYNELHNITKNFICYVMKLINYHNITNYITNYVMVLSLENMPLSNVVHTSPEQITQGTTLRRPCFFVLVLC